MIGVMRKSDPDCVNRLSTLIARSETALTQIGTGAATALKSIPGLIVDDNATSVDMNIQKLLTNRGKILIYHDLTLNYVIAKSPYRDKLRMVELDFEGFAGFTEVGQYLVYSVKVPQRVQDEINHAVKDAERTGELRAITDKYLRD
jgi:ABC-type amino acid transport substrate-binding protein